MDLRDFEAFITIAKLGSVTAAAEYLHLSQPALSRRIHGIEEELDILLFERAGAKIVLTPAGKVFLKHCISITLEMKNTVREMNNVIHKPNAFSIAMVDILAEARFAGKFRDYCKTNSHLDIHLHTTSNDKISEMIVNGQADIGFRYFQDHKIKNVEQIKLSSERLIVISAFDTRLVPNPCTLKDLHSIRWITFPNGNSGSIFTSFLDSNLLSNNIKEGPRIEVGSLTAQKRLAEADLGLCFLPESIVQDEIRTNTLQIVSIPSFEVTVPIIAMYRTSSTVIGLLESFIDLLSTE